MYLKHMLPRPTVLLCRSCVLGLPDLRYHLAFRKCKNNRNINNRMTYEIIHEEWVSWQGQLGVQVLHIQLIIGKGSSPSTGKGKELMCFLFCFVVSSIMAGTEQTGTKGSSQLNLKENQHNIIFCEFLGPENLIYTDSHFLALLSIHSSPAQRICC